MVIVRLTYPPNEIMSVFPKEASRFYFDYSEAVFSEVSKRIIKDYIGLVLKEEGISDSFVNDIRIMRFPFGASQWERDYKERKNLPNGVYFGHYLPKLKRIDIYPPSFHLKSFKDALISRIRENEEMSFYFFCYEPLKTLLHEYLHIKYLGDEPTVKKITDKHMRHFEKKIRGKIRYTGRESFFTHL